MTTRGGVADEAISTTEQERLRGVYTERSEVLAMITIYCHSEGAKRLRNPFANLLGRLVELNSKGFPRPAGSE